jgi:hypothetical protein
VAQPQLVDYDWLVSEDAAPCLAAARSEPKSFLAGTKSLRRQLGAVRAALVLEQAELRRRAANKFSAADRMFFTARLLEQSTDEMIAAYKGRRYPSGALVIDFCCGIGGDLLALAQRGPTLGVDRDPVAARLAAANCRQLGRYHAAVAIAAADVCCAETCNAWHIDPDRRGDGRRTTRLDAFAPDLDFLRQLISRNEHGGVKTAPATVAPEDWNEAGELEWIGCRRECRQQVAWFGNLARHPGRRTATVVLANGEAVSFSGHPEPHLTMAASVGRFVFEPHSAVLAARLSDSVGAFYQLESVIRGLPYLTGDKLIHSPLLAAFEVLEVLSADDKRLRAAIRGRRIGALEVKVRGVDIDPRQLQRRLRAAGDEAATLILAGGAAKTLAILGRRVVKPFVAVDSKISG